MLTFSSISNSLEKLAGEELVRWNLMEFAYLPLTYDFHVVHILYT